MERRKAAGKNTNCSEKHKSCFTLTSIKPDLKRIGNEEAVGTQ